MSNTEEIIEGHPHIPERDRKMLTPGSTARIYRDGEVLEGIVLVPERLPLELRHLAPGSYVLQDETGGYEEVAVHALEETTTVHTAMSRRAGAQTGETTKGTAEPGSSFQVPGPEPAEKLKPIYPDRKMSDEPEEHPQVDVPVLAEPGSALIQEIEDPDEYVDFQLESLKGDYSAPTAATHPVDDKIPAAQKPGKEDQPSPPEPEGTVEHPVVLDDRKRQLDPSVPDEKAGEIAATVLPSEQVTEDPAPVSARRKQARTAKPAKRPTDG